MLFDKYFIPVVIPERVYALLKLVKSGQYTRDDLKELMLPRELNKNQDEFNTVFKAVSDTNLIKINEFTDIVECLLTDDDISSVDNYRRYMSKLATSNNNLFIRFTSWYISQNQDVFFIKLLRNFLEGLLVSLLTWKKVGSWMEILGKFFRLWLFT